MVACVNSKEVNVSFRIDENIPRGETYILTLFNEIQQRKISITQKFQTIKEVNI